MGYLLGGIGEDIRGIEVLSKDFDLKNLTGLNFENEDDNDHNKDRYENDEEEKEEISVDSEEENRIQKEFAKTRKNNENSLETNAFKQVADDDEDYEDYENNKDEAAETMEVERSEQQEAAAARKPRPTRRPIPDDLKISSVLEALVDTRTETIYRFSDLFFPEHSIIMESLKGYAYSQYIRNPDDMIDKAVKKLGPDEERHKEYLELFYQAQKKFEQEQQLKNEEMLKKSSQQDLMDIEKQGPQYSFDFQLKKEQFEDPFQISKKYVKHNKINSHEWFAELEQHLTKNMQSALHHSTVEVEEEIKHNASKKPPAPVSNVDFVGRSHLQRSLAMGSSTWQGNKHLSRRGTFDLPNDTPSRAETPSREATNLHNFLAHLNSTPHNHVDPSTLR